MDRRRPRIAGPPAIKLARPASAAEMRLIRSELNGLFGLTSLRIRAAPLPTAPHPGARSMGMAPPPRGLRLRFTLRRDRTAVARAARRAEAGKRGERALAAAVAALGADAGNCFMSDYHRALNGPPVEMAAESDAGLRVVEAAISIEARRRATRSTPRRR